MIDNGKSMKMKAVVGVGDIYKELAMAGDDPNATDKCDAIQFTPIQKSAIMYATMAAFPDAMCMPAIRDNDNTPKSGTYVGMEKHKHALKRNDPCHCGSGNKFKKCCMGKKE